VKPVMRSAIIVPAAQYSSVALGVYWGRASVFFERHRFGPWGWPGGWTLLDSLHGLGGWLPAPTSRGIEWIPVYHFEACLAALVLAIAVLRILASPQLRRTHRRSMWVCLSLFCYLAWLMYTEPFLGYRDIDFVVGVLLLTPVLLTMSPLVRYREWLGLAGAVAFFATSLAMLIHNGCPRGGQTGFF
jgi:hypothetical protein